MTKAKDDKPTGIYVNVYAKNLSDTPGSFHQSHSFKLSLQEPNTPLYFTKFDHIRQAFMSRQSSGLGIK
jgi:hypothetical protein